MTWADKGKVLLPESEQPEWTPFWRQDLDAVAIEYYKQIGLYERLQRYEGSYRLVRKVIDVA